MTKKEIVQIASRAMALYLIFWALDNLSYVPVCAFSVSHYGSLASSAGQGYLYKYHLIMLLRHLALTVILFIGAIWVYGCGPTIAGFLSFSEN